MEVANKVPVSIPRAVEIRSNISSPAALTNFPKLNLDKNFVNSEIRRILLKMGVQRSYDDLLMIKACISDMDFMKYAFVGLHPAQVIDLCRNMNMATYKAKEIIFRQNDPGETFYVILSGRVEVLVKREISSDEYERMSTSATARVSVVKSDLHYEDKYYREDAVITLESGQFFGERALDTNEPRAATIRALVDTELLCVTREAYRRILKADVEGGSRSNHTGIKARVIRALSKGTNHRSPQELEEVSTYLWHNIPFFKKFSHEERIGVCQVADLVVIYGKTVLFKQGDPGQAFYVILSGTVDVLVFMSSSSSNSSSSSTHHSSGTQGTTSDGKPTVVNTLKEGMSFGERAIESEDCTRTATVITDDDVTELLVISKDSYFKFIRDRYQRDLDEKISLLRDTHCFASLAETSLRELCKFMEPKVFHMDTLLYKEGEVAQHMMFICKGDCNISRRVTYRSGKNQRENMGRVGPGAVLAPYVAIYEDLNDEIICRETVKATSLVQVFVISKYVFYTKLRSEVRAELVDSIKQSFENMPVTALWDNIPLSIQEDELIRRKTWAKYKAAVIKDVKDPRLVDKFRKLGGKLASELQGGGKQQDEPLQRQSSNVSFDSSVAGGGSPSSLSSLTLSVSLNNLTNSNSSKNKDSKNSSNSNIRKKSKYRVSPEKLRSSVGSGSVPGGPGRPLSPAYSTTSSYDSHSQTPLSPIKAGGTTGSMGGGVTVRSNAMSGSASPSRRSTTVTFHQHLNQRTDKDLRRETSGGEESSNNIRRHIAVTSSTNKSPRRSRGSSSRGFSSSSSLGMSGSGAGGLSSQFTRHMSPQQHGHSSAEIGGAPEDWKQAFSLVQIHRCRFPPKKKKDSRFGPPCFAKTEREDISRKIKCYFRVCGGSSTCSTVKAVADSLMLTLSVKLGGTADRSYFASQLVWHPFTSIQGIPVQHSDIFLVYCRNTVVEYCTVTWPDISFEMDFPPACKPSNQHFACVSVRDLESLDDSGSVASSSSSLTSTTILTDNSSTTELSNMLLDELSHLTLYHELSFIVETQAFTSTKIECLWFAQIHSKSTENAYHSIVIPAYTWIPISQRALAQFEVEKVEFLSTRKEEEKRKKRVDRKRSITNNKKRNIEEDFDKKILSSIQQIDSKKLKDDNDDNDNNDDSNEDRNSDDSSYDLDHEDDEEEEEDEDSTYCSRVMSFPGMNHDLDDARTATKLSKRSMHRKALKNMETAMLSDTVSADSLALLSRQVSRKILSQKVNKSHYISKKATSGNHDNTASSNSSSSATTSNWIASNIANSGVSSSTGSLIRSVSNEEERKKALAEENERKSLESMTLAQEEEKRKKKAEKDAKIAAEKLNEEKLFVEERERQIILQLKQLRDLEKEADFLSVSKSAVIRLARREVEPEKHLQSLATLVDTNLKALSLSDDLCKQESIVYGYSKLKATGKMKPPSNNNTNGNVSTTLSSSRSTGSLSLSLSPVKLQSSSLRNNMNNNNSDNGNNNNNTNNGNNPLLLQQADVLNKVLGGQWRKYQNQGGDLEKLLQNKLSLKSVEVFGALHSAAAKSTNKNNKDYLSSNSSGFEGGSGGSGVNITEGGFPRAGAGGGGKAAKGAINNLPPLLVKLDLLADELSIPGKYSR